MQKFFELEELHPKDREWTNRGGNGTGAGAVSISGTYVWTPADEDDGDSNAKVAKDAKDAKGKTAVVAGDGKGMDEVALDDLKKPDTPVEVWDLHLSGLQIPSGKLTAVVGQVRSLFLLSSRLSRFLCEAVYCCTSKHVCMPPAFSLHTQTGPPLS